MKVSDVCKEFFTGFDDLDASLEHDDPKMFVSGALKVAAYCTCVIPVAVALTYAADVLVRHYHLDQRASELSQKVFSVVLPIFQGAGKEIREKAVALSGQAYAFAKARYQDALSFKDQLMGKQSAERVAPNSGVAPARLALPIEERAAVWVGNLGAEYQSERLAYILAVLEKPAYQANPREYVRQWIERRGSHEIMSMVKDFALWFFKQEFGFN